MNKKTVVLFYFGELPEEFCLELRNFYELYVVPVLQFEFGEYGNCLESCDFCKFDCIVFPSKRAVEAVYRVGLRLPDVTICSVGESTSAHIRKLLNVEVNLTGSQGAEFLASQIIALGSVRNLLYLSGTNQATLPFELFKAANIQVTELVCYGTKPVSEEALLESVQNIPIPEICVFFSPTGVKAATSYINWPWESQLLIAIGKTTAASLQSILKKCDGIPSESNLTGIKNLLLSILQ